MDRLILSGFHVENDNLSEVEDSSFRACVCTASSYEVSLCFTVGLTG